MGAALKGNRAASPCVRLALSTAHFATEIYRQATGNLLFDPLSYAETLFPEKPIYVEFFKHNAHIAVQFQRATDITRIISSSIYYLEGTEFEESNKSAFAEKLMGKIPPGKDFYLVFYPNFGFSFVIPYDNSEMADYFGLEGKCSGLSLSTKRPFDDYAHFYKTEDLSEVGRRLVHETFPLSTLREELRSGSQLSSLLSYATIMKSPEIKDGSPTIVEMIAAHERAHLVSSWISYSTGPPHFVSGGPNYESNRLEEFFCDLLAIQHYSSLYKATMEDAKRLFNHAKDYQIDRFSPGKPDELPGILDQITVMALAGKVPLDFLAFATRGVYWLAPYMIEEIEAFLETNSFRHPGQGILSLAP